jgi:hypothetical protein
MARSTPWTATNGLGLGILAGAVFLVAEMLTAGVMGDFILAPFRMFASVLLGRAALEGPLGAAVIVGALFHFAFSALLGLAYTFIDARLSPESRVNWGLQAGVGALFGIVIYLVNFQLIARGFYPWFLEAGQFLQLVLHALFFGVPLGLGFAWRERKRMARHIAMGQPRSERTSP